VSVDLVSLSELLCDPFYQLREPQGKDKDDLHIVKPGQLVWAHIVYPEIKPQVLDLAQLNRDAPVKSTFRVRSHTAGSNPDFPIKELGLEADEKFYVLRGKRRQCIVVQCARSTFLNRQKPEPFVWVVPRFAFKMRHTPEYQATLAAFKFPTLLYLPSHPDGFDKPAALRLELIQPAALGGVEPLFSSGLKCKFMSPESWGILQHQLFRYTTGKVLDETVEETLKLYGEMILEEFAKASKPA
jgi:hypothetical protein